MQPRPETARHIDEIGTKLFAGLGSNAISVEVYGSAASDDFAPRHSDVNLFIALHNVSFADLRLIGTVLQRESDRLGLRFRGGQRQRARVAVRQRLRNLHAKQQ